MDKNILEKEKITTLFLKYAIPSVVGMLFLGINTIVDGFFVGHYLGVDALASVNIAMPFFSLIIAIGIVIGIGTQSLVGLKLGEGDIGAANDTFTTALSLMTGVSILLSVFAVGFTKQISIFLGANEQLMPLVTTYICYEGAFLPFLGIMFVLDYVLKVMGKPSYSMQVLLTAVVSHMMFNYLFIAYLGIGIKGAAIATGLSYGIAFTMAILPFIMNKTAIKLFKGRFEKRLASQIIYNGSAEGLTEVGTGFTALLFNITLMRYVGEVGVAAFTAISYLSFVGNNILLGVSDGVGAIISYNYGRGSVERVKKAVKMASISAFFIGVGIFIIIFNYAREIIAVFVGVNNAIVLNFASYGAKIYAFAFLLNGLNIVASGFFTAICYPKNAAFIAVSKGIVWIGICVMILPMLLGISGIWLTVPTAEALTFILSVKLVHKHFKHK